MAPDLNSLPPSRSTTSSNSASSSMARAPITNNAEAATVLRGQTQSPSTRSTSTSSQAAATVNTGLQYEDSRRSSSGFMNRSRQSPHAGRRRSASLMTLQLNDPSLPAPGEMVNGNQVSTYCTSSPHSLAGSPIIATSDPHHSRAPSLGELHQELEQEQEAQSNRLLQMIRPQQKQLQQLQAASGQTQTPTAIDDSTPTSERSMSFYITIPRSPNTQLPHHPRSSFQFNRSDISRRSRNTSRTVSPRLRSTSIGGESIEGWSLAGRDESAFYQAETQMVTRENQMLRMRIRELERQVSELHANSNITHEPATPSNLTRSQSISGEETIFRVGIPVNAEAHKAD